MWSNQILQGKTFITMQQVYIEKFCRFLISCADFHSDHSEEGNEKITNDIKEQPENLENAAKEGIYQLKDDAQYPSEKI